MAYVGGVDKKLNPVDNRTDLQKDALWDLLSSLKERYPDAHIMGHRDIWGKDSKNWKKWCPCFDAELEYELINNPVIEEPVEETPIAEEKPQKPQKPQTEKPISKGNNGILIAIIVAILGGVVYTFRDCIKEYFKDKVKRLFKKKNKKLYKIIILKHVYDKHTSFYIHTNNSILYDSII